jgi:hypothetical protein
MIRPHRWQQVALALLLVGMLLIPAQVTLASEHVPPIPIEPPRLSPLPIPHTSVLDPAVVYNVPKPAQVAEANQVYNEQPYYQPGAGVIDIITDYGNGGSLYPSANVCNNFDMGGNWASSADRQKSDIWSDYYAGWGPFAVDDGIYQAKNTVFSVERTIGPGVDTGPGHYSVKIGSNQPFAGGFGSPKIKAAPGTAVSVTVKYLLWDYVQAENSEGRIQDWASLGFKPDAAVPGSTYVNGYIHGQWDELTVMGEVGASGEFMVLLQGQSTGSVNANVYFDDIQIKVGDEYLDECLYE